MTNADGFPGSRVHVVVPRGVAKKGGRAHRGPFVKESLPQGGGHWGRDYCLRKRLISALRPRVKVPFFRGKRKTNSVDF